MNLSARDAAGLLKVSEKTIDRGINQLAIPTFQVQDQHHFNCLPPPREAIAPTADGHGIPTPHVRNRVVLHVGRPSLRGREPVD
jgi:hypothetical protein